MHAFSRQATERKCVSKEVRKEERRVGRKVGKSK
jgi:hypothetical protein